MAKRGGIRLSYITLNFKSKKILDRLCAGKYPEGSLSAEYNALRDYLRKEMTLVFEAGRRSTLAELRRALKGMRGKL